MYKVNEKSNLRKIFGISFMIAILFVATDFGQGAGASQKTNTDNKADKNLKSIARINPSTLAMEFSMPMMSYPGRSGNSLPFGMSYSSKVWRMDEGATYWYQLPYSCTRQYVSQIRPMFAERSAAGWTSSVAFPVIEEKQEIYNEEGKPYSVGIGEDLFNNFVQSSINEAIQNGGSQNLLYACGSHCREYTQVCIDGNCSGFCHSGWETTWCEDGTGSGGCPPPGGGNPPTPPMFHVKRVHVRMGDGSTHEFRKSDFIYEGSNTDNSGMYLAVDGSGLKLERTTSGSTLYLPDGSRFLFPATSTGNYDRATLFQANEFIDSNGNRSTFLTSTSNNAVANNTAFRKLTDTLGREIFDPLPQNLVSQQQTEGTQEISLPSMEGKEDQKYELDWQHLKPVPCDANRTTNCGNTEGALENQNQNAFYYTSNFCFGSFYGNLLANPNNINDPANEVLFPMNGIGVRSCNPFSGNTPPTAVGVRFNPVVLGKITLPNNKQYIFKYNQYGEITKIIYPTGSYETFVYDKILPIGGYNGQAYDQTNRGVKERRVYKSDGTLEQRWRYDVDTTVTNHYKVTTIAPKGNDALGTGIKTERYLYETSSQDDLFGFGNPLAGMPKEERSYDENNVLRARSLTEYNVKSVLTGTTTNPNVTDAKRDARVKRTVSVMIENGLALASLSETEYNETGVTGNNVQTDAEYFSHLDVKRTKGYHYAVISLSLAQNGTLAQIADYFNSSLLASVSETDYDYNLAYKTRGIHSLPTESRVLNPANNEVIAKTQTVFDETAYLVSDSAPLSGNLATTWVDPGTTLRGKPTTAKLWDNDNNSWIETHTQYNQFGNVRKAWDASGDPEKFSETEYSADYAFAYPTKVITPGPGDGTHGTTAGSFATTTYDFMTGLSLTATNEFNQTTQIEYNDALLRPTRSFAVNFTAPESQTIYDDTNLTVKVRKQIDETNWDEAISYSDSLGRTIKTQAKDSQGDVFTETEYDLLGRVKRATNPYRSGDTKFWSKPRYDEMGRAVESFAPAIDGVTGASLGITEYGISTVASYTGTFVMTTDAAGKKSRAITNGLGQLIRIDEPDYAGGLTPLPQSTPNPSPTPIPTGTPDIPPPGCTAECLTNTEYPSNATVYRYNEQGKMVEVIQGDQHRYFKYDSLGRLIRVRQPEQEINGSLDLPDNYNTSGQWTAKFVYDLLGNVISATDANGTVITNTYDKANRVITKTYSNEPNGQTTPAVEYFYDGFGLAQAPPTTNNFAKGKLTKVTSSVSETRYTNFDQFGRLTQMEQRTPVSGETIANAVPKVSSYQYNFAGALVKETYPSGRTVSNEFEADGDLSRIYGKANSSAPERTYASGFSYTADGKIQRLKLGNNRWESAKFNERLQVTELALGTSDGDGSLWKLKYDYGELQSNGVDVDTNKNTGNIAKQTITFNGLTNPLVQTFKYDSLYRLTEARETNGTGTSAPQTWKQSFGYDRYGNRTGLEKYVGTTQITLDNKTHPTIDPSNNRFNPNQGYVYDKNGNLIDDPEGRTFVFNGDNKQRFVVQAGKTIGEYFYDGEGNRVKKLVYEPNTTTVKEETIFVYSAGKLIEEYSTKTPPQNPTTSYTATDQLGSPRVITDSNGNVVSRRDFMPFGEEITNNIGERAATGLKYGVADGIRQKFTGYQKDDETNLDFAEARMYENRHGRFTAVDPLLASGKSANPQTFNRYVYVMNSPLAFTDPSGLQAGSNICPPQCPSLNIDPNYNGPPGIITTVDVDGGGNQSLLDLQEDYGTTISNSVLSQPTLSVPPEVNYPIRALLGGFPESPFLEAGKGLIKGPPNFVIDTTNFITQKGGYAPNRLAIQRFGCSSSIECNWSTASTLTTGLVGGVVGGVFRGASSLSVVSESNFARTALTNEQIIQKSATIAERRIGGTGAVPGTLKHTYSQRLINRYQSIYGDRGLVTERSWLNGSRANYGTRGSSRLDVLDTTTMNVYDFKFTIRPPALTTRQINQIRVNGPAGIRGIFEINP